MESAEPTDITVCLCPVAPFGQGTMDTLFLTQDMSQPACPLQYAALHTIYCVANVGVHNACQVWADAKCMHVCH